MQCLWQSVVTCYEMGSVPDSTGLHTSTRTWMSEFILKDISEEERSEEWQNNGISKFVYYISLHAALVAICSQLPDIGYRTAF